MVEHLHDVTLEGNCPHGTAVASHSQEGAGSNPCLPHSAKILTPWEVEEEEDTQLDELETIPVLDEEPFIEDERDREHNTCHLTPYHPWASAPLCGSNSSWFISISEYRPGPTCHSCGHHRCTRCVAILRGHGGKNV